MKLKRFTSLLLGLAVLSVAVPASYASGSVKKNAEAWATPSTVKVARNVKVSNEDKQVKVLSVEMFQNESEGVQLTFNALSNISDYEVTVSKLYSENAVIGTDAIDIYHEKYLELSSLGGNSGTFQQGDFVPDAILPFDKAVEYGENTVKKGDNQSVYIEITTQEDTLPGVYFGEVALTTDGYRQELPIKVKVHNVALPDQTNVTNYWANAEHWFATWERDGTREMKEKYLETELKYNMQGQLPFDGEGGPEAFAELVKEYSNKDGFSTYWFYYEYQNGTYKGEPTLFNAVMFKDYVKELARLSVEDKTDYLSKAFCYFYTIIDEPHTEEQFQKVKSVLTVYKMALQDADEELRMELMDHDNYGYYLDVVSDSVIWLPNVLPETTPNVKLQLEELWGIDNLTHCTTANFFGNEGTRELWDSDDQDWWFYTCCVPLYPYASNFIEDGLLGMRLISWMQYVYDIAGYLNWSCCVYDAKENPYEDLQRGFIGGDGYMFYPGAPYGIYGPVASLRAVAYRDGTEDYDAMKVLEERYAEFGLDARSAIEGLFNVVCSGTIPTTDAELYAQTKKNLISLVVETTDEYGVIYGKTQTQFGMATVELAPTNENAEIFVDGVKQTMGANGLYALSVNLMETDTLTFSVKTAEGEKVVSRKVGNRYSYFDGFESGDVSYVGVNKQSALSVNTDEAFVASGAKSLKINFNGLAEKDHTPYISFNAEFLKRLDITKVYDLEFEVYNDSELTFEFDFQGFTGSRYRSYATVTIKPGWNSVKVNGICVQNEIELVKGLYMTTDNFYVEGGVNLYVDEIYYSVR